MHRARNSSVKTPTTRSLSTLKLSSACRKTLKMSLVDSGVLSHNTIARKLGLEKNAVNAWMVLFRRAVPFRKHEAYLSDIDRNDPVSILV